MTTTHHTNGEVHINGKRVGWAETYMNASRAARQNGKPDLPSVANPFEAFVFYPMTSDETRGAFSVINERLYSNDGKLNQKALEALV